MKTINVYSVTMIITLLSIFNISFAQEWESTNYGYRGNNIQFLNSNTGFIGLTVNAGTNYVIYKTTNKGLNFSQIWVTPKTTENSKGFGFDMINESIGYLYVKSTLYRTSNGGITWDSLSEFLLEQSIVQSIKFYNDNVGFITFTPDPISSTGHIEVWRITNGGHNRSRVYSSPIDHKVPVISDITISNNGYKVIMVGYYKDYPLGNHLRFFSLTSDDGGQSFSASFQGLYGTQFSNITYLPNSLTEYRVLGSYDNGIGAPLTGSYCYDNVDAAVQYKITNSTDNIAGLSFVDANKGYAYIGNKIFKTENSGVNWSEIYTINSTSTSNRNALTAFNDIIYSVDQLGNLLTHKLPTNLNSYIDNQLGSGLMNFDGISYPTSGVNFLRGGNSVFSSSTINPNQSNEKIFYKWDDGNMVNNKPNYYLDMSGTTIANYYKTKQLSTIPTAISNPSQSKSVRDVTVNNVTATHSIHESMGGIFYSKSTDFGLTYQTEEIVNLDFNPGAADGNKNASLSIIGNSGSNVPITAYDQNRNVAVVWEKYNSTTGKIEIKLARRVLNVAQTGYEWVTFTDNNGNQYVTAFIAPSNYECKPNCFITSDQTQLQQWNTSPIIVTYLRPDGSQNKLIASVRYNSQSMDYELDNGDITDLSTVSPFNNYRIYEINFAYKKANNIVYRKEYIGIDPSIGMSHYLVELNNNISIGDGYSSRYRPDISIMDGHPVVSYAANYNSNAWVSYESGETDIININRYPIIKVQKQTSGLWGNYIIYNSNTLQDNPDVEGSSTTESYLINYKLGNEQFKKVVKVNGQQGYFCEPNTFTGTDSKLIKNSYTGSFGNNLSLLTLAPEASLYRLSKQNFAITNIQTADQYDNFGGVVNLDTVRYSFNLGPVMIKEPDEELEEVPFGQYYDPAIPVVTRLSSIKI